MNDEHLDILMRLHATPPASSDCIHKVLTVSASISQKRSVWKQLRGAFDAFSLPAPAYSFTSFVLIGFIAGFAAFSQEPAYDVQSTTFEQLILNNNEGVL